MTAQPLRVWLVDDDNSIRWVLERALKNGGMVPKAFDAAEPALAALRNDTPDVLITDIRMSGHSGLDLLPSQLGEGGRNSGALDQGVSDVDIELEGDGKFVVHQAG